MKVRIVRLLTIAFLCLFFFSFAAPAQEKMTRMVAGPSPTGDRARVIVAFIETTDESFKTQTLIADVDRVKKGEQPNSFYVDLTSTIRNSTGGKDQKILVVRWDRLSEVEVKCDGGKFIKETKGAELDNIVTIVKAVVQNAPTNTKGDPVEFTITKDLERNLRSILDGLKTSTLQCVRNGS